MHSQIFTVIIQSIIAYYLYFTEHLQIELTKKTVLLSERKT